MPVLRRILKGYKRIFSGVLRLAALLAFCVAAGFAVSWPAWKLAGAHPRLFTALFLAAAGAAAAFFIFRRLRLSWRTDPVRFRLNTVAGILLLGGLALFVRLTLARHVPAAFACLAAGAAAAGFVRFGPSADAFPAENSGKGESENPGETGSSGETQDNGGDSPAGTAAP